MHYLLLAGPILFAAAILLLGFAVPGYSPKDETISELVLHKKYGVLQTLNFLLCGLLIAGLGWAVLEQHTFAYGAISIIVFGLVLIVSGLFKTDPVPTNRPTAVGAVHNLAFAVGFITAVSAQIVVGIQMFGTVFGAYSLLSAALVVGCEAAFIYFLSKPHYKGFAQRGLVLVMMAWFFVLALTSGV